MLKTTIDTEERQRDSKSGDGSVVKNAVLDLEGDGFDADHEKITFALRFVPHKRLKPSVSDFITIKVTAAVSSSESALDRLDQLGPSLLSI
ncbi:hypothetical protein EVAR_25438_1 [Eumeta japonica]|uniref:Uncharacterized protein n=1 Tax=Eumeta variegata TaxID=151549 RepID=A0A4C1V629_EUMVA|nr:hypothetical protein EVAR_25438_1 [Eumeta japonica]